ncbi:DUF421 domain-containing protein [Pseudorhodoferax sp. Leaf267]|uniref:DUF421 domain-containing protein n=1 Tax=Pseudorhodoferax sp. Leaf267 TaxID=1736316 RepID=UPI0006FEDB5D|nr:YetF domain-containing protein [Pseudorhodoferax sp. Leaf267]KQP21973.1 hypothetical protein ASF43_24275 [Pseudorhodoferax sp. Leaf267]
MPDLAALFGLSLPPAEILIRGTAVYWFLFLLFRFVLRRDTGAMAITDVLLLVVIADAAQNAMAGEYTSITDGVLLVSTIAFWNYALDWAAYHWLPVRHFVEGEPLHLVRNGKVDRRSMRRELMTMDDLMAALREHGVECIDQVKSARMEKDGEISIIRRDEDSDDAAPKKDGKLPV